jgi:hypothetical protein
VFDVTGDHISQLNDEDLRTLVANLALAELQRLSLPLSGMTAGGNQNAPDGGIDVRVSRPAGSIGGDFIPRDETGIQVKKSDMPNSAIRQEMRPKGTLRPVIAELAAKSGSYIIVSGNDSVSDSSLRTRRDAMRKAVNDDPNAANLHTEFYDRERVANWLRQYPGTSAWVLKQIGRSMKGWQPFRNWSGGGTASQTFLSDDNCCITDERTNKKECLSIAKGIARLRESLSAPGKCVRLIGLSGVGKTRLVEALFESDVGTGPLPTSIAVYTDTADEPDPSARDMARRFIQSEQRAILIVDNCNLETHAALRDICTKSVVSLITIEYDVSDGEPEGTDVFRLGTSSENIVEKWLQSSHPHISEPNRYRIAAFSDGNFRVAKALAFTIKKGETLGTLNDKNLLERIFIQRNEKDQSLLRAAEIFSLVYSFDGEDTETTGELASLAALSDQMIEALYSHIPELKQRGVLQERSKWRAILPHAIANKLAGAALDRIMPARFDKFVATLSPRLLKSLSRRLGYLHDDQKAQAVIARWLSPTGWMSDFSSFTEDDYKNLWNIAPVAPEAILDKIEILLSGESGPAILVSNNTSKEYCPRLLHAFAYKPSAFNRAVALLVKFIIAEPEQNNRSTSSDAFKELFQLYFSGTHALPNQRREVIREMLLSREAKRREYGLLAFRAMLDTDGFGSMNNLDFGARPRDYGWHPKNDEEQNEWFSDAITLARELLYQKPIAAHLQTCIADAFRGLWRLDACKKPLEDFAVAVKAQKETHWTEGWLVVRHTLRIDGEHMAPEALVRLNELEQLLKPSDFIETVRAYIFCKPWHVFDIANFEDGSTLSQQAETVIARIKSYGVEVAKMPDILTILLGEATSQTKGRISPLGQGLAEGAEDVDAIWQKILAALALHLQENRNLEIVAGYLLGLAERKAPELEQYLDDAITSKILAPYFPQLQAIAGFNERGVERLQAAIKHGVAPAKSFSTLEYGRVSTTIPAASLAELLYAIAAMPNGSEVAVGILRMRYHGDDKNNLIIDDALITYGQDLLLRCDIGKGNVNDTHLNEIIKICLAGPRAEISTRAFCQRVKSLLESESIRLYQISSLLDEIFSVQPIAALDEFFPDNSSSKLSFYFTYSNKKPVEFAGVANIEKWVLINPSVRIPRLAKLIHLFTGEKENGDTMTWSPLFLRLLELAPNKAAFLDLATTQLRPNSWSDSLAPYLERRIILLKKFIDNPDGDIRAWATSQIVLMADEVVDDRNRVRQQDESFE